MPGAASSVQTGNAITAVACFRAARNRIPTIANPRRAYLYRAYSLWLHGLVTILRIYLSRLFKMVRLRVRRIGNVLLAR